MKYFNLPSILLALLLTVITPIVYGQTTTQALSLDKSPVEDQFQYVYKKSNDFEEFKMVKRWHFSRLKAHVMDTINLLKQEIVSTNLLLVQKESSIDSLVTANSDVQSKLNQTVKEKESLTWLGISMQKSTYNSIVWTIIFILIGGLLILFLFFKRSHSITSETKQDLSEIRVEFEAFRKRALEREEGIVRKYHDELNKYKKRSGQLP